MKSAALALRSIGACLLLAATAAVAQGAAQPGDDFLRLVDGKQYAESWDAASDLFRQAVSRNEWVAQVRQAREPLGAVVARTLKSLENQKDPRGAPPGDYLLVTYDTTFAASPKHWTETLPLIKGPDAQWHAVGYFVR